MKQVFSSLQQTCRSSHVLNSQGSDQKLSKGRSKLDKEQLSWNMKQNLGSLYIPVPSKSQVKRLFSMALNHQNPPYKPSQNADLSSRKAKTKSRGFEKCHPQNMKKLKRNIFNFEANQISDKVVPSQSKKKKKIEGKKNGYSTEVSMSEELNKHFDESQPGSLCSLKYGQVDLEQIDYERRERQRVSEAKKMVREVMKNIRENRRARVEELLCMQKESKLIDFELNSVMKSIKKSRAIRNREALYSTKIKFFLSKTGKRIKRSLLAANKKELSGKVSA